MIVPPANNCHYRKSCIDANHDTGRPSRRKAEQDTRQTQQQCDDYANTAAARRWNAVRTTLPRLVEHAASVRISDRATHKYQRDDKSSN